MRYKAYLRERYRIIAAYTAGIGVLIGLILLSPLLSLLFFPDVWRDSAAFITIGGGVILLNFALWWFTRVKEEAHLSRQEGMVILSFGWTAAILTSALPFIWLEGLTPTQAIFEAASGWTGTGFTVLDVGAASPMVLMFRSTMQLVGGAGFAIIVLTTTSGLIGTGLSSAEGRDELLVPNVRRSAEVVLQIYLAYNTLGTLALWAAGMSLFDALNHTFAAIGTGGFSTRPEGVAYWDSQLIEIILMALMTLGMTNFATAYLLAKRKYRAFLFNGEIRTMVFFMVLGVGILLTTTTRQAYGGWGEGLRYAAFEAISAMSCTGFSLTTYTNWSDAGWMMMIALMLIGGGSGSTAAGIKLVRIYILAKALVWEVRYAFLPGQIVREPIIWRGEQRGFIKDSQVREAALFGFFYLFTWFVLSIFMMSSGYDFRESLFEVASALSGVGLSSGLVSPADPPYVLLTLALAMLLGRLEFFALLIGVLKMASDAADYVRESAGGGV
jgi:trk system potassium uptake protein TrkH